MVDLHTPPGDAQVTGKVLDLMFRSTIEPLRSCKPTIPRARDRGYTATATFGAYWFS